MLTVFSYFAVLLSGLQMAFVISFRWLRLWKTHVQFDKFGMASAVEGVVQLEMKEARPWLYASFTLSIVGMVGAIGLLKRRSWSRPTWIVVSATWFAFGCIHMFRASTWDLSTALGILFKGAVVITSVSVLYGREGRTEFLKRVRNSPVK